MSREVHMIDQTDHERIAAAIREAESRTSGEIFAVVAGSSDDYFYVAAWVSALWAIATGVIFAALSWVLEYALPAWIVMGVVLISLAVILAFFHFVPQARLSFIPRSIGYRRASASAVKQFLAHGIHETSDRSGVLLFVSVAEKYAEVVADSGINAKVDQSEWNAMVATLTDHAARDELGEGFIHAVEQSGKLLASHFPPKEGSENELEDKLIEI